jgi:hypothetical protein
MCPLLFSCVFPS